MHGGAIIPASDSEDSDCEHPSVAADVIPDKRDIARLAATLVGDSVVLLDGTRT